MVADGDILRDLGYLALGSRLKRLAEHLQADAAKAHARMGYPMKPAQFPLLAALEARGPLTVSEAVAATGVSQPAVTRTLGSLVALELVETERDRGDSRLKRIRLSPKGTTLLARMRRDLWPHVDSAAAALAEGPPGDLLELITRVEDALQASPLEARIAAATPQLRIVEYDDALAPTFASITRAWVEDMFALEANDRAIIEDPRRTILDPGGKILFVEAQGLGVVGTCALMRSQDKAFELTKMGVLEQARGKKAGAYLLHAVLDLAQEMKATGELDELFLLTNSACQAAIHLYEKHGFVHDQGIMERFGCRYARCDVAMSYPL